MSQLKPLTTEEQNILLPKLIKVLNKTSKTKTLYAPEIVIGFNNHMNKWGYKGTFTETRLRKLINHIRYHGILPIISGPHGYYITNDKKEIIEMAKSLEERAESILSGAKGLRQYAQEIENNQKEGWETDLSQYNDLFYQIDNFKQPYNR
jgi:hypothetical protein